jgi:hypothetical protein
VVQPGRPKVSANLVRETFVLAEDNAEHERTAHSADSAPNCSLYAIPDVVSDAGKAASSTGLPPGATPEHDVDSLARQPGSLVEATLGLARLGDPSNGLEDRTPRR